MTKKHFKRPLSGKSTILEAQILWFLNKIRLYYGKRMNKIKSKTLTVFNIRCYNSLLNLFSIKLNGQGGTSDDEIDEAFDLKRYLNKYYN